MSRHVLVGVDGSDQAEKAFEFALGEYADEEITVLRVLNPRDTGYRTGREAGADRPDSTFMQRVQEETAFLDEYVERGEKAGVSISSDYKVAYEGGQEARAIIDYAEDHSVDLIVLGSHGRTGSTRILLGSVAEHVVRRAHIPVMVVR